MNVKDVTVTFTLEADVDAIEFMDSILLVNGQNNWPDCLVGTHIASDVIRPATTEEIESMGYEEEEDDDE